MKRPRYFLVTPVLAILMAVSLVRAETYTVTSLDDSGDGTLRWALEQAATHTGADTIVFSISGTIAPVTALPEITDDETVLDASSQWQGTWPGGEPGVCIDGSSTPSVTSGFVINGASSCRISGLSIVSFPGDGISVEGGAQQNTIGGSEISQRNVISGNGNDGIDLSEDNTADNLVIGNYIGTTAAGDEGNGNSACGVRIGSSSSVNTITGNVISANGSDGIMAFGPNGTIAGNIIGLDCTATTALGNDGNGITLYNSSNTVGGWEDGDGNEIACNSDRGVYLSDAGNVLQANVIHHNGSDGVYISVQCNTLSKNEIYANAGTGIKLGSSAALTAPTLTDASMTGATLHVQGSGAGADALVEIFRADDAASGEGEEFLGQLTADGAGAFSTNLEVNGSDLFAGDYITATTTHTDGATSAFSAVFLVESDTVKLTAGDGAWTDGSTWRGGAVPLDTDDVVIREGHTVTVATGYTCNSLRLLAGSTLEVETAMIAAADGIDVSAGTVNFTGTTTDQTVTADLVYGDLTLSGSAAKTLGADLEVTGDLTVSGTAAATAQGAMIIGGTLTVESQGTLTLGGTLTLAGNLRVMPDATFAGGAHTIELGGSWYTPGDWQYGTSTLVFAGSSTQHVGPKPGADGDAQVGEGTTNINGYYPFDNFYENGRSQLLYLGNDIGLSGTITSLQFEFDQTPTEESERTLHNLQITMFETSDTNWSSKTNFASNTGATTVLSASTCLLPDTTGWFEFPLDTPFTFDASANLVVEIQWGDNGAYVSSYKRYEVRGTTQSYTGALYGRNDSETPPNYDGRSTLLPNIVFSFQGGGTVPEFYNVTVGSTEAALVESDVDLQIHGNLGVGAGSELVMGENILTVDGTSTLLGPVSYETSADVTAAETATFSAGGMDVLAMSGDSADPGTVDLAIHTGITCPANAFGSGCSAAPETVKRYFDISPATSTAATVRFTYLEDERNGRSHDATLHAFHWNNSASRWDTAGTYISHGGAGTTADPYYIEFSGIDSFSPFVLGNGSPDGALNAPSDLTATATSTANVNLQWQDNAFDETGYHVERREDSGNWALLAELGAGVTFHADGSVTEGILYEYRVQAVRGDDFSDYSESAETAVPLLAPASLSATAISAKQVDLTWTDNSSHEAHYEIQRKTGDGAFAFLVTLDDDSTSCSDTTTAERETYTYRARAVSDIAESGYSNDAEVTTPLATPTNLSAYVNDNDVVVLRWTDNSAAETGYVIQRRDNSGTFADIHTTGASATSWTDATVTSGNTYDYRIAAVDAEGRSPYSNEDSTEIRAPKAFYVRQGGGGDGSSWDSPKTLDSAIGAANVFGDLVHVAAGTYNTSLTINAAIQILGGYPVTLTGTDTAERSPADNETIIDAAGTDQRVVILRGATVLDGLTLRNGDGGVFIDGGAATVTNCTITGNSTTTWHGGGIRIRNANPTVTNNTITQNYTKYRGGGIWVLHASPLIQGNTITWNEALYDGGGIMVFSDAGDGNLKILDNEITDNTTHSDGGGLYLSDVCLVQGNHIATNVGTGLHNNASGSTIENNTIEGNQGHGTVGGSGTTRGNTIVGNSGRGMHKVGGTVDGNLISGNQGGGISVGADYTDYLVPYTGVTNNIIVNNHAASQGGGALVWYCTGEVTLTNNTFAANSADDGSDGIWIGCAGAVTYEGVPFLEEGFKLTFRNCIIRGNGNSDAFIYACPYESQEQVQFDHCDVGTITSEGDCPTPDPENFLDGVVPDPTPLYVLTDCIDADPLYAAAGDYHIQAGSPCVNKATATNAPDHDYDGDPRPWDGGVDIGADEACSRVHNVTADTWHATITEALVAASDNDEIEVYPGTYQENLALSSPVTLKTANSTAATVIEAADPGSHVVEVTSSGVTVQGFVIQGATGTDRAGIAITGSAATGATINGCQLMFNAIGLLITGGTSANELIASTIAHNTGCGVRISGGANNNTIGGDDAAKRNWIYDNGSHGVHLTGANTAQNWIEENWIGIDADETVSGNVGDGVRIEEQASNNGVGNTGHGNLIAGSTGAGIRLIGPYTVSNQIYSNTIGLAVDGVTAAPNAGGGIDLQAAVDNTTIGGAGAANIISGNALFGIRLTGNATEKNTIEANWIGPDANGNAAPTGTTQPVGILIEDSASANAIGADGDGTGNVISGNGACGVRITGTNTDQNVLRGNRIGTAENGTDALPNGEYGVELAAGASKNQIGKTFPDNTISGNTSGGVHITGSATTGNIVTGNRIGVDISGVGAPSGGTQPYGVVIDSAAHGNRIGNLTDGNMISANTASGILIEDSGTTGNVIGGNRIGIGESNDTEIAAGNGSYGVHIRGGAAQNVIGGMLDDVEQVVTSGNHIAANTSDGILIEGSGSDGNRIIANDIGGGVGMGNDGHGVNVIDGACNTVIGTADDGEGNTIRGNTECGVRIDGAATTGATIRGNRIGTDESGTEARGNLACGVRISGGSTSNTIGGTEDGAGNLISGNSENGIEITGSNTSANTVLGNRIGTDADGAAAVPNEHNGILLAGGAANNTIGSTDAAGSNTISGNTLCGVRIEGDSTAGNTVLGNVIGLSAAGTAVVPNGMHGVLLTGAASGNTIGGSASTSGNTITGNTDCGVRIEGDGTDSNFVRGNRIGLAPDGTGTIANSAQQTGVDIADGAAQNIIGGGTDTRNVIADNVVDGIHIHGLGTSNNEVDGNHIGTNATGDSAIPNGSTGIHVSDNASANVIGTAATGNLVSGNDGIAIHLESAPGTSIAGNVVGLNLTGTGRLANADEGLLVADSANVTVQANQFCAGQTNGIVLEGAGTTGVTLSGNWIGTNSGGASSLGNAADGILIRTGATGCTIGADNEIAYNGRYGIAVDGASTTGHTITQNRIHDNTSDGIALLNGGNGDVTAPVIERAKLNDASLLTIEGVLSDSPSIEIEVFSADSAGSGEGVVYLGSTTTSADGSFTLTVDVSATGLAVGDAVTATATYASDDTSAFGTTVVVIAANHAPTLDANVPAFPGITEDETANTGVTVAWLLGQSNAADLDNDTLGIAVIAASPGNGTWQIQPDGAGDWSALGTVSADQALLLASDTRVRLLPDEENGTTATLTYVAWDGTDETVAGTRVDAQIRGGETAFSAVADSATLTVEDVNDAPVLEGVGYAFSSLGEDETDTPGVTVGQVLGDAASDCDEGQDAPGIAIVQQVVQNGAWQYSLGNRAVWQDIPAISDSAAFVLASTAELRFRPDAENGGSSTFTYRAWDGSEGTSGNLLAVGTVDDTSPVSSTSLQASVTVTAANDAPTGVSLSNDTVQENDPGAAVGDLVAIDVDDGDTHTFEITADPDAMFRIENGSQLLLRDGVAADTNVAETHSVTIRTTDSENASAEQQFTITVTSSRESIHLSLATDWNLLAIPFVADGTRHPDDVFADPGAGDNSLVTSPVWIWDTEAHCYLDATSLDAEVGFWAYRFGAPTESGLLVGDALDVRPDLHDGWNLVGVHADMSAEDYRAMVQSRGDVLCIWGWDPETGAYYPVNDDEQMRCGLGYWIQFTETVPSR